MSVELRTFGVGDTDVYWRQRQVAGRTKEGRLHRFLARLIDRLVGPGAKVLDCGVGDGHVVRLCRDRQAMYGVELSAHAISRYDFPTDNIRQADLNGGIPDFGLQFDLVLASMILHWLSDPPLFLSRVKAALRSDGYFLVVIPNITYYRFRLAFLLGRFPPISLSHRNFQTPREFEQMVVACGCRIVQRTTPKTSLRARLWPNLFSQDIVYVLQFESKV